MAEYRNRSAFRRVWPRRSIPSLAELAAAERRIPETRSIEGAARCPPTSLAARASFFSVKQQRLFVASMVDERSSYTIHAFAALMASDAQEVMGRLEARIGPGTARTATIVEGFDPSEPIAASLLSDSVAEILADVDKNPEAILRNGLDVFVEHRFA